MVENPVETDGTNSNRLSKKVGGEAQNLGGDFGGEALK